MSTQLQAIRGMNDVLPEHMGYWHYLEKKFFEIVSAYGYQEIRFPILEKTELFKRSIGEITDIVEKEMYTFDDRSGESVTLRPEGTAGCVRAAIEHGLLYNQVQRFWLQGPMFRHERPQKGRHRQFYQFGVEAFGMMDPEIDAEIILISARFWKALKLDHVISLQINSLGSLESRHQYRDRLVHYFSQYFEKLDEDSKRRLGSNPLRILDSKNPAMAEIISGAPLLTESLDEASQDHFNKLCQLLNKAEIKYQINPRLVRGLDYYNRTVFEWVTHQLGAQGTVCAGGRYDSLVEFLGGKSTPAVGFAMGVERLVLLLSSHPTDHAFLPSADIYFVLVSEEAKQQGLIYAEKLRDHFPKLTVVTDCTNTNFKSQFKRADHSKAKIALILGEDEVKNKKITLKFLRGPGEGKQETLIFEDALKMLGHYFIDKQKPSIRESDEPQQKNYPTM